MPNTCPSSSHQLVAASIAFRRARCKFPKNLQLRSRSGYFHKEPKETSPGNVKSGSSSNKQIRNVSHKTPDGFLKKEIKKRPDTCCSYCRCQCKRNQDDTKEINLEKLKNEKSGGDVQNILEIKKAYRPNHIKLNFDTERRKYFRKLPNSPVGMNGYDEKSRGSEMAALSVLQDRTRNLKNDPETQYDLLTPYEKLRQDQNDFPGGFYGWENRNHPLLSLKTISRNGVVSGGCSCCEQSSEIASRQESCLRPSFVKAQQLRRIYDKNCSKGCFRYGQSGKQCPGDWPLTSTTVQLQEDEVVPIDHKDSVTILVEKFRDCAKIKDQDGRNCEECKEDRTRSLQDNYKMSFYGNKKSGGCTNVQNNRNDFRQLISKNPRSRANGTWRHTF